MSAFSSLTINLGALIGVLYGVVAVMIIVILYHVLFIVADLRKVTRRFEDLTSQVEAVILKPLSIADQAVQWAVDFIEHKKAARGKHPHAHRAAEEEDEDEAA